MYHLFNKFYLDFTNNFNESNSIAIISNGIGTFVTPSGQKIIAYKHIDQLIDQYTNSGVFFNTILSTKKKQVIYCDRENFIKLLIRFHKTLLPNIDLESGYLLCKLIFSFYIHVYGLSSLQNSSANAKYFLTLKQPSFEEYSSYWNILDTFSFDIRRNIKKIDFSYEHLLATYLCDQQHWTKEVLQSKMEYFYARMLADWLRTILNDVAFDIYFAYRSRPDIVNSDWKNASFETICLEKPELAYLFELLQNDIVSADKKWIPDIKNDDMLYQLYNTLLQPGRIVEITEQKTIYESIRNNTFEPITLIEEIYKNPSASSFGINGFLTRQLNTHLHHYILNLFEEKNLETIKKFSIIGL